MSLLIKSGSRGGQPPGMESGINFGHPLSRGLQYFWVNLRGKGGTTSRIRDQAGRLHLTGGPVNCEMYSWATPVSNAPISAQTPSESFPHVTVLVKVKRISLSALNTIICRSNSFVSTAEWIFSFGNLGQTQLELVPGGVVLASSFGFGSGVWYTLGFRRLGGTGNWSYDLFLDGRIDSSVTGIATNPPFGSFAITLFGYPNYTNGLFGAIQYCAVWSRGLSLPEVRSFTRNPYQVLSVKPFIPATYNAFNPAWAMSSNILVPTYD